MDALLTADNDGTGRGDGEFAGEVAAQPAAVAAQLARVAARSAFAVARNSYDLPMMK